MKRGWTLRVRQDQRLLDWYGSDYFTADGEFFTRRFAYKRDALDVADRIAANIGVQAEVLPSK